MSDEIVRGLSFSRRIAVMMHRCISHWERALITVEIGSETWYRVVTRLARLDQELALLEDKITGEQHAP